MKNLRPKLLVLTLLFSVTSTALTAALIPDDNNVIVNLGTPTRSELPAKKIKFLIWNLHKGADAPFKKDYLELIKGKDIIVNQEIFLDDNMTDVFALLPDFLFTTATSFFSGKEVVRTGVANISKVPPVYATYIRTQTLEPFVGTPKVCLVTSYPIKNSVNKLTVVNIHGINFVSSQNFLFELHRIYSTIKNINGPLVFTGDFNTWNQERITLLSHYIKSMGLKEAQFFPDNRMTFNGYPLDHFFHTEDLKVTKAKVQAFYKGSDHKPLEVEVEYSDPEQLAFY